MRETRDEKRVSQKYMIEAIDCSTGYFSNIENGNNYASLDKAVAIANTLDVSLDYLCGREKYLNTAPVTMGDIAKVLMTLYYLDGVTMGIRKVKSETEKDENGDPKIKSAMIIKIESASLREFLKEYCHKVENSRQRYNKYLKWLKDEMVELDAQSAWDHRNVKRWSENLKGSESNIYPQDLFQQLIWNHTNDLGAMIKELESRSTPPKT